ncbi:hypothetical protein [Acinetobacter pittii]|uniref:hypothetical protein n=1 Tax=Acinetobacter pittii TaxID=48296 RepID=UPI00157FD989|nr:hypothetical protein [Acinetobacter pittii]NUF45019.1 hypothetical protein [Acinetobacter pittii]
MSNTTKVLREQSGIQYQGVQDKSEADPRDTLSNTVFTGTFKRGRFDKPFKVTTNNIRSKLGYDPKNLTYMAIEDCLKTGAPYAWVLRTEDNCNCESSMVAIRYNDYRVQVGYCDVRYRININDKEYVGIAFSTTQYSVIDGLRSVYGTEAQSDMGSFVSLYLSSDEAYYTLENLTSACLKVKIQAEILERDSAGDMWTKPAQATVKIFDIGLCANTVEPR